jgi:hypothetical protein
MASGIATAAKIKLYAVSPSGAKTPLFSGVNEQTGPSGSPDGVQATVKANELPFMPISVYTLVGGVKIVPYVTLTVADGLDASDCVFNVPIQRNGQTEVLSASDLGISTDFPASTPAGFELPLGTGYTVPENDKINLGGGNYFMSVQNDTA